MQARSITMLGTGLIGDFYDDPPQTTWPRRRAASCTPQLGARRRVPASAGGVPESTTDLEAAIRHLETDVVVVGPELHAREAVSIAADAGKAILCTKPLGRTADEAKRMLDIVERAGVFAGYLEDLCYTPKTLKAIRSVEEGAIGDVTWVRSRETHPGPHSAWFWDGRLTGGGAIIDLGCHCIEIIRNFVGKGNRPVEVLCHTDTLVHPIADEDNAVALIRFESGAIGQFEVSWTFRGGMDLRDEVAGTHGTIWLNHFLRTGFEMFTAGGGRVRGRKGRDVGGLALPGRRRGLRARLRGHVHRHVRRARRGRHPRETFYDGYVVNAIMDACYRSAKSRVWEPIDLDWRGGVTPRIEIAPETYEGHIIKREVLPDGRQKLILKDAQTGDFVDRIVAGG